MLAMLRHLALLLLASQSVEIGAEAHERTALSDDTPICKINQTLCGATCLNLYDDVVCCDNQCTYTVRWRVLAKHTDKDTDSCTTYAYSSNPASVALAPSP